MATRRRTSRRQPLSATCGARRHTLLRCDRDPFAGQITVPLQQHRHCGTPRKGPRSLPQVRAQAQEQQKQQGERESKEQDEEQDEEQDVGTDVTRRGRRTSRLRPLCATCGARRHTSLRFNRGPFAGHTAIPSSPSRNTVGAVS